MEVASNTTYLQKSAAEMLRVFSNSLAKVLAKKNSYHNARYAGGAGGWKHHHCLY
jgi:hypothetical protein